MNYIYFELKTTGGTPLFSRIERLDVLICDASETLDEDSGSFRAESFRPSGLFEEHKALKEFSELLTEADAIACPNEASVKYLRDLCKQYFMGDPFANKEYIEPEVNIEIETYEGELKHFYDNYKDYWYFPLEDAAYHKAIAKFSDKSARVKATPQTAYVKKAGTFVPAPNIDSDKLFKKEYGSSECYILLSDADASTKLHALLLTLKH